MIKQILFHIIHVLLEKYKFRMAKYIKLSYSVLYIYSLDNAEEHSTRGCIFIYCTYGHICSGQHFTTSEVLNMTHDVNKSFLLFGAKKLLVLLQGELLMVQPGYIAFKVPQFNCNHRTERYIILYLVGSQKSVQWTTVLKSN